MSNRICLLRAALIFILFCGSLSPVFSRWVITYNSSGNAVETLDGATGTYPWGSGANGGSRGYQGAALGVPGYKIVEQGQIQAVITGVPFSYGGYQVEPSDPPTTTLEGERTAADFGAEVEHGILLPVCHWICREQETYDHAASSNVQTVTPPMPIR